MTLDAGKQRDTDESIAKLDIGFNPAGNNKGAAAGDWIKINRPSFLPNIVSLTGGICIFGRAMMDK